MAVAEPLISVIIPVRNAKTELAQCLAAVAASTFRDVEVIVVDDGSTDGSAAAAEAAGARVFTSAAGRGAAAARNRGAAEARGRVLLFVDADVLVAPDTLTKIAASFSGNGEAAVIGSYTPFTPAPGYFSKFKNIHHHYIHQISREEAATFWTGCGAVKKTAFRDLGGFDEHLYAGATIEDIEFGYRLYTSGLRIRMAKDIQVRHLKRYNLWSLMRSDIFHRAIPWTKLMLGRAYFRSDLNTTPRNAFSVLLAGGIVAALVSALFRPEALIAAGAFFLLFALNTMPFNRYVKRYFGWGFTLATVIMSVWYFFYSGVGLALGVVAAARERLSPSAPRQTRE